MKPPSKSGLMAGAAALSLLTLSACAQEAEAETASSPASMTVEHAQGTTEIPADPDTVFTFDLGVLDTLDALDVPVAGVPQASLPESLSQYGSENVANIGTLQEPDFEATSAGDPDLIIISGRTADYYEEFSEIAPTIDLSVVAAEPMPSFREVTTTLGTIFGKEGAVEEKLTALDARIEETSAAAADAGTGLIVMTSGGEMTAYGAGSRFGMIHDALGVPTAADVASDGRHRESISFEFIAETNPDHLFVIDRDVAIGEAGDAASAVLDNDLVNGTKAAMNGAITMLDPTAWYIVGYGLNNVDAMVSAIQDATA
ncbi:siderophore ABC transporter substrate-binding protein [Arthrobacter sp. Br18]|uniref:siderophore ABC transporter substrate-binding protein n=1 Tax=Arthrobacter sp. Br18 TaxID=1312954 RepID=UPI00047E46A9|nr:siderophore ABC transporter substrate-binding protein [Arthrobacter sp. Br18]